MTCVSFFIAGRRGKRTDDSGSTAGRTPSQRTTGGIYRPPGRLFAATSMCPPKDSLRKPSQARNHSEIVYIRQEFPNRRWPRYAAGIAAVCALAVAASASASTLKPAYWTTAKASKAALSVRIYLPEAHGTTVATKARCHGIGKTKPAGFRFFKCTVAYPPWGLRPAGTATMWVAASTPTCSSIVALDVCRQPWTKTDIRQCHQDSSVTSPPDKCLHDAAAAAAIRDGMVVGECSPVKAFVFRCGPNSSSQTARLVRFRFTNGKWVTTVR